LALHHREDITVGYIVTGDGIDQGLVTDIPGIVFDDIVVEGLEEPAHELGLPTPRGTVDIDSLFEGDITAIIVKGEEDITDLFHDIFTVEYFIEIFEHGGGRWGEADVGWAVDGCIIHTWGSVL
jgi:hypothetical protein